MTDSRFQDDLIEEAKKNGKLAPDFELAPEYRNNYPEKLEAMLKPYQSEGHFAPFPFGTDFTPEEVVIGGSLKALNAKRKPDIIRGLAREMFRGVPPHAKPYLARMDLDTPSNRKERIMQKIVLSALRANGKI